MTVKNMFPSQWGTRGHILTKTLGFNALMKIFPKVHLRCVLKQDLLGIGIGQHLSGWAKIDFTSKTWAGVSGESGATKLAELLESNLAPLTP